LSGTQSKKRLVAGEDPLAIVVRDIARGEFEAVLRQRAKTVAPMLLNRLEEAFRLQAIQLIVDASPLGLTQKRHDKMHRRRIGQLARSLGHAVAFSAPQNDVGAEHIRRGFALWKDTMAFHTIARSYHRRGPVGAGQADVEAAIGLL
jgi:hypothetical protein